MANQPYLPLYTGDWKKDPELSACSLATRGVWIDLLCSIHDGHIGQITGTPDQLSRSCRCDAASMASALHELQATGAANVHERDGVFTVVCRRMKKAAELSRIRAESGSKGGKQRQSKVQARPETDHDIDCQRIIEEFCVSVGLPKKDGTACFHKWIGNGWTNGGEPIRDWKATIRSWKVAGYMPSQKVGHGLNGRGPITPAKGPPKPQPEGWEAWRKANYPESREKDFWRAPGDVQAEFRKKPL